MSEVKKLTKSQQGYLKAIRQKHNAAFEAELQRATTDIIDELGLSEELKADKATIQISADYSTVTIIRKSAMPLPKIPTKIKK